MMTAISGEKIEIDPVLGKALLFKQKAVTHDTDSIACCSLLDEKHSGRMTYRFSHALPSVADSVVKSVTVV